MKTTVVFLIFTFFSACFGIATITVGDFIHTPVWQAGKWPDPYFGRPNYPGASFANGVGIILNGYSPILIFKNNDGTYSTVEPPITCAWSIGYIHRRATTNGKIFLCLQTVFEVDGSRNVIGVRNVTAFTSDRARVMKDDTIVWPSSDTGNLLTYGKVNGEWQEIASQDALGSSVSINEDWVVLYSPSTTSIAIRQPDYSWNVTASFSTSGRYQTGNPLVYTGDLSLVAATTPTYINAHQYASSNVLALQYGIGGQDVWVVTTSIGQEDMGSDLKPSGGLGYDLLYIDDNTVIVSAPYDNYNFTRVQNGGSAFVLKRQNDNSWQFVTKFVQASPDNARLHQAVGYDNGRLYFFACRTGYVDGNTRLAKSECGFKYAEWSP